MLAGLPIDWKAALGMLGVKDMPGVDEGVA
jgi:hypothetical protein